jgi:hypothetical protein
LNFVLLVSQDIRHNVIARRASGDLARPAFSGVVLLGVPIALAQHRSGRLAASWGLTCEITGAPVRRSQSYMTLFGASRASSG